MNILPLPALDGIATIDWELAGNVSANLSVARTMQREVLDGDHWVGQIQFPPAIGEEAGVLGAWLAQARRGDRWLYLPPPQNELRGAWTLTDVVSNGTFVGGATTGWTGTGATLSVNARRLKVKNSGAAIGYARQTLTVTADAAYVVMVDLYPGSTENWRIRLLDGSDAEEHVSYYDQAGRVPIVHIPASTTLKLELGCNTAVSGDDVKFGNVTVARCLLVKDSLAVGNKLGVKSGPASTDGAIKAGQYVTIPLWNGQQMVKLVEDFDTDSAGEGTLRFEPALRDGVLGGGPVIVHQPFARMVFSDPRAVASVRPPYIHESGIGVMEDVTPLDGEVPQDTDLIWGWFADSLGLAPTIGSGTPTLTADIDNWYFDSDGVLKQVAAANTPVFEFNPITKALKGQRIQSARTNLAWPSEDLSHANWEKVTYPVTVSSNTTSAPDGNVTMDTVTATATNNRHAANLTPPSTSLTDGVAYAASVWVQRGTTRYACFSEFGGALWHVATFDFDTGSISDDVNCIARIMEARSDGSYRIEIQFTRVNTANMQLGVGPALSGANTELPSWAAAGTESVKAWGAQVEQGAFATSYTKTTTASATRAGDVDSLALNLIPGFPAGDYMVVGEMLMDVVEASAAAFRYVASLDDGTNNERTSFLVPTSSNLLRQFVVDGGAAQADLGGSAVTAGVPYRFCGSTKTNDFAFSTLGAAPATDVAGTAPTPTTLYKGSDVGVQQGNCYLRRLAIIKKKPNRQHMALSA